MSPPIASSISIPKVSRLPLPPQCSYVAYVIWLLLVCFLSLRWYWNQLQIPLTCSYYQDPFLQEQHPVPLSLPSHPLDISISEILSLAVPVIYCCLANYSKLGGLKQQFSIISHTGSGIQTWHRGEARHSSTKSGASAWMTDSWRMKWLEAGWVSVSVSVSLSLSSHMDSPCG